MKKLLPFIVLFFVFGNVLLNAQDQKAVLQKIKTDVVYLASDYLEGRETGMIGETRAAEYIAFRFEELGLTPKGDQGWYQEFPFKELVNPHSTNPKDAKEGIGKNVVAFLDKGAKTTVVIGAHYDHLGLGGSGSLHAGKPDIHNGADDNASGVAALLRIASFLKNDDKAYQNNFLFIAFSGEEKGLFGSKFYASNPTIELGSINYMFNMDMVGRLNEEKTLAVYGVGTTPHWKTIMDNTSIHGINVVTSESGVGPSDHTSFYLKNIPVLHFFTGQHQHYHKPTDDAHLINYEGIIQVSDYMLALMQKADALGKLAFTKTKDEDNRKAAAFKVTLGVMPDYVYQGKGMRIDSVIGGRVGDKGGLKDGDIVIKIGEVEVTDIYKYMEGLAKFKKGEKAKVTVLRGKKKVTKEVTF